MKSKQAFQWILNMQYCEQERKWIIHPKCQGNKTIKNPFQNIKANKYYNQTKS